MEAPSSAPSEQAEEVNEKFSVSKIIEQESQLRSHGSNLDGEETLLGEPAVPEGNVKDILNAKIADLEVQLKETTDRYEALTEEVKAAKSLYETEKEDCEDVISIARRNVQNQVAKILDLQEKRRILNGKISIEQEKLRKEEDNTETQLKLEEERLTRNVVILQTKLLLMEGTKFERDKLLTRIKDTEQKLLSKDEEYHKALQEIRRRIKQKYERLYSVMQEKVQEVSHHVEQVSQRQQIASLKERQEEIVGTQINYKKASRLLFNLMDQNKRLKEKQHCMQLELEVKTSLSKKMSAEAQRRRKYIESVPDMEAKLSPRVENELQQEYEMLKERNRREQEKTRTKLFRAQDYIEELKEIHRDQKDYKKMLDEEEVTQTVLKEKLTPLSNVAELVVKKETLDVSGEIEDPTIRESFFQSLTTILLQSVELQSQGLMTFNETPKKAEREIPASMYAYRRGSLGLIHQHAQKPAQMDKKELQTTTVPEIQEKTMDTTQKKILMDLGIFNKYYARGRVLS